ncbi:MAG TPA: DUF1761 family protein [Candidatus Saccharimonadales bacterium]|nr:DUF1761 family protein [Candidatus Saccharimonadales bacterium]
MMPINPILAAAAADMAVGMVWYSDYAFGPLWKKVHGKTNVEKDFYLRLAIQAVGSVMLATALYISIMTFQKTNVAYSQELFTKWFSWFFTEKNPDTLLVSAMKTAAFIWVGFYVSAGISCAAWTSAPAGTKFVIKVGCKLFQLLAMAAVLASLA